MNFKHLLAIILVFVLCFGVCSVAFADEKTEVPEGYTPIYTADDLNNIRNNLSGKYILMNDIDLSSYENWEPIGSSETPFTGELDGNGYLIKNLKIKKILSDPKNHIGLFGVAINSSFKKTIVENGYISISTEENSESSDISIFTGMIVAKMVGTDFSKLVRCSATGKIEVTGGSVVFAGGLIGIGTMDNGILSSTNYVDIDINTKACKQKIFIGGLLGGASESNKSYSESYFRIEKSANFGNILINNSVCFDETEIFAGGIAGFQISGNEMSECYNRGEISSSNSSGKLVIGGILGEAIWRLEKSYSTGEINVLSDENDMISAICFIKEPYLAIPEGPAMPQDFTVYNCYYLESTISPCVQNPNDSFTLYKKVFSLSRASFKLQDSFNAFDFETVWTMEENGYPVLQSQPEIIVTENLELTRGEKYSIITADEPILTNNNVVTIDDTGNVLAVSIGTAIISIEHEYNYKTEYQINVTEENISEPSPEEPPAKDCYIIKILTYFLTSICDFFNDFISFCFI